MLPITYLDECLHLSPERAVWWPTKRTLLVADTHFGKDAAFRAAGIPLPAAALTADLERLTRLVADTQAERLIVLGDLLHARSGRTEATWMALREWRRDHASLAWHNIRGNHDRHAGDPLDELRIECHNGTFRESPFTLVHDSRDVALTESADWAEATSGSSIGRRVVMAGHLHPAIRLRGPAGEHLRLPCFHFGQDQAFLPAFGAFTGKQAIKPRSGDRVFAIAGSEIFEPNLP